MCVAQLVGKPGPPRGVRVVLKAISDRQRRHWPVQAVGLVSGGAHCGDLESGVREGIMVWL